ncbi:MAG: glucosamine-6-phosphate deaminase [Candidatus Glassbacteria bacterium RIFCSPLOWO2_12_FULL_58_11]|uniref:Glucosamine-6-phosphate deaminase n=1 Tax=Candidatus Glassbacteria bacterium RIFCSPLOWO2_12_FULL_58_11 TaxID=1817867 RepID=A0A1F5YPL2_9BACT|nr:MAG: glucosamine-6-phosphate deaminase [Candidatus Glassbacteria bacterium RIFCSPLOWO2_12_FULL_58_11]
MEVIIKESYDQISLLAAQIIADLVHHRPRASLGLATGSTPLGAYRELIRMHREEGLDFSQIVTFNLDEYVGLAEDNDQSYHYFMWENLFKHINIIPANVHIPDGNAKDLEEACEHYEMEIDDHGGVDVQLLGIGSNGHIAFNEPGSSLGSRTRIKTLTQQTRRDNARFFASIDEVPKYCVTMGIGTILEARKLLLLANGASKAEAVAAALEGPITASVPASAVQLHPDVTFIIDKAAAAKLKREYHSELSRVDR